MVKLRKSSDRTCTVRVETAAGPVGHASLYNPYGRNPCAWHGAADFDLDRGAELSIVTDLGAHTPWHTVVAWRNGDLNVERKPIGRSLWAVDNSHNAVAGVQRMKDGSGRTRVVLRTLYRNGPGTAWRGERTVLGFSTARSVWVVMSHESDYRLTDSQARSVAGWRVAGLPRWTE